MMPIPVSGNGYFVNMFFQQVYLFEVLVNLWRVPGL